MKKKYGGFIGRFIAYIIDNLVFVPIYLIVPMDSELVQFLVWIILWTAYYVWMNGTYGATIGKMLLKLKIVKEDGSKITYSDALLREIGSYLSFVVLCLGYLAIIGDKKKQGWHDKISHTVVLQTA